LSERIDNTPKSQYTTTAATEDFPFFSIIIPAYNEEKYLPLCLDSIHNLNYPKEKYEVIVVDNGSTDRTREIAANRGATVLQDRAANVSGLRNYGAREAKGDVLAFLDADCLVTNDWLICAAKYHDDMDISVWGSPTTPPEDSTWVQRTWFFVRMKKQDVMDVQWLESMNLFVRKSQFFEIRGFNEQLVTCEDVDLSYRMSRMGRIVADKHISAVHLGEAGTMREFFRKELWRGQSNLKGAFSHGISLKELPSLVVPVYFGLLIPVLFVAAWLAPSTLGGMAVVAFLLGPSLIILVKASFKCRVGLGDLARLLILTQVYFFARTAAIFYRS